MSGELLRWTFFLLMLLLFIMEMMEIDLLAEKIRDKYHEYAKKHGKAWFNLDTFEERYRMALLNRMNLESFFLAEITFFEKLKAKYDKEKKAADKSFLAVVENIIEENTTRIKKYPKKDFHIKAGFELSHFYGAMDEFAAVYFPATHLLEADDYFRGLIRHFEDELAFMALSMGGRAPKRIQDHILLLSRKNVRELDIEKDTADYLKNGAFILHEIIKFCDMFIETRDSELENPLRFNKLYIEESAKKRIVDIYSGCTGYGVLLKLKEQAQAIIEDFRLKAFKR